MVCGLASIELGFGASLGLLELPQCWALGVMLQHGLLGMIRDLCCTWRARLDMSKAGPCSPKIQTAPC